MLMHLCAGHVTLLPGECYPSKFFPQSDLRRRADLRWALPQISSFVFIIHSDQLDFASNFLCTIIDRLPP